MEKDQESFQEEIKQQLIENIKEFYETSFSEEKKAHYNVAVTLYFKAIAVLSDFCIFLKEGKIPSSHSERFRILEMRYPEIYKILDKNFPFYQDSYRLKLNKEICELFRNDAEKLIKIFGI
jgi:hypothetical protein